MIPLELGAIAVQRAHVVDRDIVDLPDAALALEREAHRFGSEPCCTICPLTCTKSLSLTCALVIWISWLPPRLNDAANVSKEPTCPTGGRRRSKIAAPDMLLNRLGVGKGRRAAEPASRPITDGVEMTLQLAHPRLRRRQDAGDLQRHLHAPSVAQEVQIDDLAGLDVAHTVVKLYEVGYTRAIDADYQVVGLTEQ